VTYILDAGLQDRGESLVDEYKPQKRASYELEMPAAKRAQQDSVDIGRIFGLDEARRIDERDTRNSIPFKEVDNDL